MCYLWFAWLGLRKVNSLLSFVVRLGLGKKVNNNMLSLVGMVKVSEEGKQQYAVWFVQLGLGKKVNNMLSLPCMAKVGEDGEQQPVVTGLFS